MARSRGAALALSLLVVSTAWGGSSSSKGAGGVGRAFEVSGRGGGRWVRQRLRRGPVEQHEAEDHARGGGEHAGGVGWADWQHRWHRFGRALLQPAGRGGGRKE